MSDIKIVRQLNIQDIFSAIPHRYPFLMIDRLDVLEEVKRAVGYKNVSGNEPFFQGHFPGRPIMPGVLQVEALAQTACVLLLSHKEYAGKLAFFMSISDAKFRRPVLPGDVLELHVEILRAGGRAGKARGKAQVSGEISCETEFSFALVDR